jgi:hypothetical protein
MRGGKKNFLGIFFRKLVNENNQGFFCNIIGKILPVLPPGVSTRVFQWLGINLVLEDHQSLCTIQILDSGLIANLKLFSFQRGDLIDVISMNPSGLWRGRCDSRVGHFKFITVELLADRPSRERRREMRQNKISESEKEEKSVQEIFSFTGRPDSVEDLLKQIGLEVIHLN